MTPFIRLATFGVSCWLLILAANWFVHQPEVMRAAGNALVMLGFLLIGSARG